ncbi:MAG: epoxide hydrolase [Novosphingobium sp.]
MRPFKIEIPDNDIEILHRKIDDTRWPAAIWHDADEWDFGAPEGYLRELVAYWRDGFDWRSAEGRLNAFDQFITAIDGLDVHFIHARSPHPTAKPLLLVHGWPGSVAEFLDLIPRLTHPEEFGGVAADAFHVVAPSLPGFAWSEAAHTPGMAPHKVATQHANLMAALGYDRFVAQGGDWGALCCRYLPEVCPKRLMGLHLNLTLPTAPPGLDDPDGFLTDAEREYLVQWEARDWEISGYSHLQGTKPQSLAYGLSDSPVGLAAWIAEKFDTWTDSKSDLREAVSWDALLINISIYWFTNSIGSSMRLYKEFFSAMANGAGPSSRVEVPTGIARYPAEHWVQPASWAELEYNLIHVFEPDKGGHFAAMEQPEDFASDLRAFLSKLPC